MTEKAKNRKDTPVFSGVMNYFPDAIKEVAKVSFTGNEQHNPGSDLFWDRSKSGDELDALSRHLLDAGTLDDDGLRHSAKVAWRALANLQKEIENDKQMGYEEDIIALSKELDEMYPEVGLRSSSYGPCSAHAFFDEELEEKSCEDYMIESEERRERRMDIIGRNGNDGEHYDQLSYLSKLSDHPESNQTTTRLVYPGDIEVTYEIQKKEG